VPRPFELCHPDAFGAVFQGVAKRVKLDYILYFQWFYPRFNFVVSPMLGRSREVVF
jgi:hypothetical protein